VTGSETERNTPRTPHCRSGAGHARPQARPSPSRTSAPLALCAQHPYQHQAKTAKGTRTRDDEVGRAVRDGQRLGGPLHELDLRRAGDVGPLRGVCARLVDHARGWVNPKHALEGCELDRRLACIQSEARSTRTPREENRRTSAAADINGAVPTRAARALVVGEDKVEELAWVRRAHGGVARKVKGRLAEGRHGWLLNSRLGGELRSADAGREK
jgi:hypothetical protein